jgi:hypothetical protein
MPHSINRNGCLIFPSFVLSEPHHLLPPPCERGGSAGYSSSSWVCCLQLLLSILSIGHPRKRCWADSRVWSQRAHLSWCGHPIASSRSVVHNLLYTMSRKKNWMFASILTSQTATIFGFGSDSWKHGRTSRVAVIICFVPGDPIFNVWNINQLQLAPKSHEII